MAQADQDPGSATDSFYWMALLRSAAGYQAFRRRHPRGMVPEQVAAFLLSDPCFPRSVACCLGVIGEQLTALRRQYNLRAAAHGPAVPGRDPRRSRGAQGQAGDRQRRAAPLQRLPAAQLQRADHADRHGLLRPGAGRAPAERRPGVSTAAAGAADPTFRRRHEPPGSPPHHPLPLRPAGRASGRTAPCCARATATTSSCARPMLTVAPAAQVQLDARRVRQFGDPARVRRARGRAAGREPDRARAVPARPARLPARPRCRALAVRLRRRGAPRPRPHPRPPLSRRRSARLGPGAAGQARAADARAADHAHPRDQAAPALRRPRQRGHPAARRRPWPRAAAPAATTRS